MMGTRSLTRVNSGKDKYINMYRQFDGYPSGHGKDLHAFLTGMVIVNGYNGSEGSRAANGPGCLSAQLVANFKTGIGEIYIYPVDSDDCGQDYEYIVEAPDYSRLDKGDNALKITVISHGKERFSGTVEQFGAWCLDQQEGE